MPVYGKYIPLFGDLHNHCNISYAHGDLEDAIANAREQLDFFSVTGHAFWPDMPAMAPAQEYIRDYHLDGFAKLKKGWPRVQKLMKAASKDGEFIAFLSFEMHSNLSGDRTIIYKDDHGEILYANSLADVNDKLRTLRENGTDAIALPHHIGYKRGWRGINWDHFSPEFSPVVEIISMHGCSEGSENTRPVLHSMGPSDYESTMQCGLAQGHVFGVLGSTDHHSAHPGSHGHGLTGLWAESNTRQGIWDALMARRTYALTGDRMDLRFSLNDAPLGSEISANEKRHLAIDLHAGGAIDHLDILRNNRLIKRISDCDVPQPEIGSTLRTKLYLGVGWGERNTKTDWDVSFGISEGTILAVEPRFKGAEVVAPNEADDAAMPSHTISRHQLIDERNVSFQTTTFGNPNNSTCAVQGVCIEIEVPVNAEVRAQINDQRISLPLQRLLVGACSGHMGGSGLPAWRLDRAPAEWEYNWQLNFDDVQSSSDARDVYYIRVRQKNDQWAWSSPIFVRQL